MDPVCVLKDDQAVWEYKGGPVTEKLINETYTEECLTCDDLLEKNKDKFKWMCKIEVYTVPFQSCILITLSGCVRLRYSP